MNQLAYENRADQRKPMRITFDDIIQKTEELSEKFKLLRKSIEDLTSF